MLKGFNSTCWYSKKQQLQALLKGKIPAFPPHFELLFQLEKEMLGVDRKAAECKNYGSEAEKKVAMIDFDIAVKNRLIDDFGWAAVPAMCYEPYADRVHDITALKNAIGEKALVFTFSESGVFWMPNGNEMMDFVVRLFERPEEMHKQAREKCEAAKQLAKRQIEAGVDFIIQNTDFGFNQGPFISPKHFSEFVTPYMTEIVGYIHDLHTPVILHSDGDLRAILDQLYSTGVDGYQSVDPQGNMDIKEVRNQYPDWLLMGNVPCNLLQDIDEQNIRQAVRLCMEHGGIGKRYIFSSSNCIFEGMPPESYLIMLDEYKLLCMKGIKNECAK